MLNESTKKLLNKWSKQLPELSPDKLKRLEQLVDAVVLIAPIYDEVHNEQAEETPGQ